MLANLGAKTWRNWPSREPNTIMGKITDLFCQVSIIVFFLVVVDLYFLFLFLFPWALFKR